MNRHHPIPHHRWVWLVLGLIAALLLNLSVGSVPLPLERTLYALCHPLEDNATFDHDLIWLYRLPKAVTAIIAGSGLALCGLLMQRLFQNALAGPFVLGVSSGASLGAALFFMGAGTLSATMGVGDMLAQIPLVLFCVIGGLAALLLIAWASIWIRDVQSLLIVGLMFSSFGSAIVSVLAYFSEAEQLQRYAFWSFGSLGSLYWSEVGILAILWTSGVLVAVWHIKGLNALLAGNQYLLPLGISPGRLKWALILVTAVITGGLTAFTGPIAFIGLAVPHISRMLLREVNHRIQLPATLLIGAILLLVCDTIAQVPGSSAVLPINAITSFFGAPVVIWLIVKRRSLSL